MTDLSNLLETHTAQNSRLRDQNAQMASKMGELVAGTENIHVYTRSLEGREPGPWPWSLILICYAYIDIRQCMYR